jgi:hypothetical protein
MATQKTEPCVWPFERLNVDTLGRIALCGQDISFRTADLFPNANDVSIARSGRASASTGTDACTSRDAAPRRSRAAAAPRGFAGIRDWEHGWLKVLKKSGDHVREVMRKDLGAEVEIFQPRTET